MPSMAIVILAVHDVRAPREQADILGYLFNLLILTVHDVNPVLTHVNPPRIFSDLDRFDDLVLTRIDDADKSQIAIGSVQVPSIGPEHSNIDSVDLPEIFVGIQYRNAGHFLDLDLLQ